MIRRSIAVAALLAAVLAAAPSRPYADTATEYADGAVFVIKPGKTPLRAAPKLDAPAKGAVSYGQKVTLKERTTSDPKWLHVQVPGDPAEGWIPASAAVDKRPSLDAQPVGLAASHISAAEGTTTTAIRGLDSRTVAYAKDKQLPPEAFAQLSALESFGEQLFGDHHATTAKGGWTYPDQTAPGRYAAARTFAAGEGLSAAAPSAPKPPSH